jgi:hypothetical protein
LAYNFQTEKIKIKLHTEYESVTQKLIFGNAVRAALCLGENVTSYIKMAAVQEIAM